MVESNNTGTSTDDFEAHEQAAWDTAESSTGRTIADQLQTPLVVPVFPRPSQKPADWSHYVHALDDTTMAIDDGKLERVDLQLLSMVEHAQNKLQDDDYPVSTDSIMLNGFSASGNFVDRFAVLHPEEVISVTAGGLNGMPLLPLDEFSGQDPPYHVGTADFEEMIGEEASQGALNETNQFLYMGEEDDNDTLPYDDAWTDDSLRELAVDTYGDDMIFDRFVTSQKAYQEAGVEAQFRIYPDAGHTPRPAVDDIIEFHRRSIEGEDVSEFGQAMVPDPQINVSPSQASVGEEVEFDASDTVIPPVEEVLTYLWDFDSGTEATGETTTYAYDEPGSFTIALTTITDHGHKYQSTIEIEVEETDDDDQEDADECDDDSEHDSDDDEQNSDSDDENDTGTENGDDEHDSDDDTSVDEDTECECEDPANLSDELSGFGIGATLAGLGGGAYALKRRLDNTDSED